MKRAFWILVLGAIGSAAMAVTLTRAQEASEAAPSANEKVMRR